MAEADIPPRPFTTSSNYTPTQKPWYTYLTLDLILHILSRSVFHPFIVLVFYISLAAVHKHKTPLAFYTLIYAAFLALVDTLVWINRRITDGPARKVDWASEVVVLTGGATGLGRSLLEIFAMRGVSVAVLDVKEASGEIQEWLVENGGCVGWYLCDVADAVAVMEAAETIGEDLGRPTILINNAVTSINGKPLFLNEDDWTNEKNYPLESERIKQTINVNVLGHFNILRPFLGDISLATNGGTIVTVSSILAHLGPASLSDYTASKAAVSSLHHTLTNEIYQKGQSHKIKTVLVEVGQMATDLFGKAQTPWYAQFLGPKLEAKDVAKEILRLLDKGHGGVIRRPAYAQMMVWYGVLPGSVQRLVRWFSRIDKALNESGRTKKPPGARSADAKHD